MDKISSQEAKNYINSLPRLVHKHVLVRAKHLLLIALAQQHSKIVLFKANPVSEYSKINRIYLVAVAVVS